MPWPWEKPKATIFDYMAEWSRWIASGGSGKPSDFIQHYVELYREAPDPALLKQTVDNYLQELDLRRKQQALEPEPAKVTPSAQLANELNSSDPTIRALAELELERLRKLAAPAGGAASSTELERARAAGLISDEEYKRRLLGAGGGPSLPAEWDLWTDAQKAQYLARQASGAQGGRTFEQDVQLTTMQNMFAQQRSREEQAAAARRAASEQAIQLAGLQAPWATSTGNFGGFEPGGPYEAILNMAGIGPEGYKNRPMPVNVPVPNPNPTAQYIIGSPASPSPTIGSYIGGMQTNVNPTDLFNFIVKMNPTGYVPPSLSGMARG